MGNIVPFSFENNSIRVVTDDNGEPWFVGKDVAEAIGYTDATNAMKQHCKGVAKYHPLHTAGGMQEARIISEPDVLRLIVRSGLPAADKFERLVFEEILPTIRKTGTYSLPGKRPMQTATEALKLTPLAVRAARAFGLDKNAAAISANQFVKKLTGVNLLENFGHTHLEAENQDALYFTPSELGARVSLSAQKLNQKLADAGFQVRCGKAWEPTATGKEFSRIYDTGKKKESGTPVQQVKWAANVMDAIALL